MAYTTHGLSIGIERAGRELFLKLKAVGRLTHNDYKIITPVINAAISEVKHPVVNVLIDASELNGWEVRAAWDDFKLGAKHSKEFKKIAIYGNKDWQERMAKIGNWFITGEIQYYENATAAIDWLDE